MTHRKMYLGIAGLFLAVVGLMALSFPVHLDQYDAYGIKVTCGRGFDSDLTRAAQAHGSELASGCSEALMRRRAWAIPAVTLGWVLVTAFLVSWVHHDQHQNQAA